MARLEKSRTRTERAELISKQSGSELGGLTPNLRATSVMDASAPPSMPSERCHKPPQKPRLGMAGLQAYGSLEEEDFGEQRESRVRLYGVDRPERGELCFEEATERY